MDPKTLTLGEIAALRAEIDLYAPGSRKRTRKLEELFLLKRRLKFRQEWVEVEFREKQHLMIQSLYNEISDKIGAYAKKNGYDAIFKIDRGKLQSLSQDEMKMKTHTRTVIYSRKALDLTDEMIRLLNQ